VTARRFTSGPIGRAVKRVALPVYFGILVNPLVRWVQTRGYRSGKIALGEKNRYGRSHDWITVDIEGADFDLELEPNSRLPFADASQSAVYSCHVVEHLDDQTVGRMFDECFRILKPGGRIRVETPDAERIMAAYRGRDEAFLGYFRQENERNLVRERGCPAVYAADHVLILGLFSCFVQDDRHVPVVVTQEEFDRQLAALDAEAFGKWCVSLQTAEQQQTHGHVNVMPFGKLSRLLSDAGFVAVSQRTNGDSGIEKIGKIERPDRAFYSMYAEAVKP
jgi:SAM-dependent methyltransferase